MTMLVPKRTPRRVSVPAQYGLAVLAGVLAACVTAIQPGLWTALVTDRGSGTYLLSFIPLTLAVAAVIGVLFGYVILSLGKLAGIIASRMCSSPRVAAIAAGTTVALVGLLVAVCLALIGYGPIVWPVVVVVLGGALLLFRQTLAYPRPRRPDAHDWL